MSPAAPSAADAIQLTDRAELSHWIRESALALGFDAVGIIDVTPSEHAVFYEAWLRAGMHGTMSYLSREDAVRARLDPARAWPSVRSAVVAAFHYDTAEETTDASCDVGIIARYARGRDYHRVLKQRLLALLTSIETRIGRRLPVARAYVDTGPVLERELAKRAGLGWFGRNTMLIHPRRGSYFFIGSLLLDLELTSDAPFLADHCGTCSNCVSACPTGALLGRDANGAPVMDATRCISYLTIEHRGPIPRELRPLIGNRIYGCDICQEVCPWNSRFSSPSSEPSFGVRARGAPPFGVEPLGSDAPHPGTMAPTLIDLLAMALSEASWESFSRGSAMRRAGRAGFARNVCIGLGNAGSDQAVPVLTSALRDPEPLVRGHAAWALGLIGGASASEALAGALTAEDDDYVRGEIESAMGLV